MEDKLYQVLAALNGIDVHGENSCRKMAYAIAGIKEVLVLAQQQPAKEKGGVENG